MANTLMRNFRKPADKQKSKMTMDEMLAIQIANDANTAEARKQIKLGVTPALVPEQIKTLDDDLLDQTKQEQDARRNLQDIGFRPDVVQDILTMMTTYEADPAIILKFNTSAPAIKKDMKDKFTPSLITPNFFMDYLERYIQQLDATRGIIPVLPAINRFNGVIDNTDELQQVVINPRQINEIVNRLSREYGRGDGYLETVLDNLRDLQDSLPDARMIGRLNLLLQEDRVEGVELLQQLVDAVGDLPTRDDLADLLKTGSTDEILEALGGVSEDVLDKLDEINDRLRINTKGEPGIGEAEAYFTQGPDEIPPPGIPVAEVSYPEEGLGEVVLPPSPPPTSPKIQDSVKLSNFGSEGKKMNVGLVPKPTKSKPTAKEVVFLNDDGSMLYAITGRPVVLTGDLKKLYVRNDVAEIARVYGEDVARYFQERPYTRTGDQTTEAFRQTTLADVGDYILGLITKGRSREEAKRKSSQRVAPADIEEKKRQPAPEGDISSMSTEELQANLKLLGQKKDKYETQLRDTSRSPDELGGIEDKLKRVVTIIDGVERVLGQRGLKREGKGVQRPRVTLRKVGKGIELKEQPRYIEFGKYCIHLGQLEKDDILNVKYLKTNATVGKFPPTPVSEQFKDFIMDLIQKGGANQRFYSKVPPEERKLFQDISTGAGIFTQLNLPKTTLDSDAEEEKRFEILRGEWVAGNNSPLIIRELRKLIMKFMNVGKINRRTGKNLLLYIA
jgi:hypothetical protein